MIVPTPEQAAIITAPFVPLRVAAGAGTGKTTTMAARVVHLVTAGQVEPERLLGITFTNKAAGELADRIRQMLRESNASVLVDEGREVEVHTYHGFAAQILREFGALVGVERRAGVITPTFTRQLLSQILRSVELPGLDATYARTVEDLRRLGSSLGDHLLIADEVAVPEFEAGSPWELRSALLTGLTHYQREKRRLGVSDYADLVVMAHRLLTRFPEVAAEIRDRYQAVLLDEYQDTNPGQRELLRTLFPAGFPLTAVGDADQTIYEWRGASPDNFESFPVHFPLKDGSPSSTLHLTENRRSHRSIINLANSVRARTGSGQPDLVPLRDRIGGEVAVSWHDSSVAEAEWIARTLAQLHAHHNWKDMAVLFRKNKDMVLVHDALRAGGIPVEVANLGGLLTIPEVADLRAWLAIIQDPSDEPSLFRVLMGSRFRLGMGDLRSLAGWVRSRDPGRREQAEHLLTSPHTLLEAVDHLDEIEGLRPAARMALERFGDEYRHLLSAAQGVTLVELCRRILDRVGAWQDLASLPETEQLTARLNLYRFLDLTEEWSPLEGRPSLEAFLDFLSLMDEDATEELDTARLSGEDAVILLTVHRAKGLEWEVVFVPACYRDNFPTRSAGFENPYRSGRYLPYELRLDTAGLPPITADMEKKDADDILREHHLRQEWRVAYVAMTRAKERLFVSGATWYGHPEPHAKPVPPSDLWRLVAEHSSTRVESSPAAEPPPRPLMLRFEPSPPGPDPVFHQGWDAALRTELAHPGWAATQAGLVDVADSFVVDHTEFVQMLIDLPPDRPDPIESLLSTSVTGLVTYAGCPRRFFWTEVDRLPRRPNPAARHGTDIHRRIELHHRGQLAFDDVTTDLYDLPEADSGPAVPEAFSAFTSSRFATVTPWLVEAPFEVVVGDLRVRGRIDAVYQNEPGVWEIVDFKSGRRKDDPNLKVQLEAYALAAVREAVATTAPQTLDVTFAYLGGGLEVVTDHVDFLWMEQAADRLVTIATGITDREFAPTPSPACTGCDFLRFCPAGKQFVGAH
ncbi:MAG: ATP-dependent DNA helicase [Acidimicrobiia bacterium]